MPDDEATWLDAALKKPVDVMGVLHPYPVDLMEAYPVDRRESAADRRARGAGMRPLFGRQEKSISKWNSSDVCLDTRR